LPNKAFAYDGWTAISKVFGVGSLIFSACRSQNKVDKLERKGLQLFEKGIIAGALSKFEEIIQIDNRISLAHLKRADCLNLLGDVSGSIESYSKAIEIDPKNKIALYYRALTYEKFGDIEIYTKT
jgi:Tfp pilus assembly protein PilF